MATERNPYWDTVKAILICLVVLGHTGTALNKGLLSVIYAFHMPLFVFVSGFFSRQKSLSGFWHDIKRLIIIYVVFDSLYIGLDLLLGESVSFRRILIPSFALWYLLSLIIWKILLQFLPSRWSEHKGIVLLLSIVIALVSGFVPINTEMSFQRTCVFFPFFMLGYYSKNTVFIDRIKSISKYSLVITFIGLAIICYLFMPVFYANEHYSVGKDLLTRSIQLVIAGAMCVAFLGVVPKRLGRLTDLGQWTLLIYLLHPPVIKVSKMVCKLVGIPMSPNVLMGIVISILAIALIYLMRNWRVFKYLS